MSEDNIGDVQEIEDRMKIMGRVLRLFAPLM